MNYEGSNQSHAAFSKRSAVNPFTNERAPYRLNACVGENGWPGIHTYIDGYDMSVRLLAERMIKDERLPVDTLIYPFFFSARHRIELSIKSLILAIAQITGRSRECSSILVKHDLQALWDKYAELAHAFDRRYARRNQEIASSISDFFVVDSTGQTFRYPFSAEDNQRHLVDYSVLNIAVVYAKYLAIDTWFSGTQELTHSLSVEFALGTRTSRLSRRDLIEIANILPNRDDWKLPAFDCIKQKIRSEFGIDGEPLSSNDLTKALNIIQSHRELKATIGMETRIATIDELCLKTFVGAMVGNETPSRDAHMPWQGPPGTLREIVHEMPDQAIATVLAFYTLGRELGTYSEFFDETYQDHLSSLAIHRSSHINYLLRKHSFLEAMVQGMRMTGQTSMLKLLHENGFID